MLYPKTTSQAWFLDFDLLGIPISSTNKYILSLIYFTRMDFSEQYDIKNQA
jgi:hypothetical protein